MSGMDGDAPAPSEPDAVINLELCVFVLPYID
jgi:hypothetical protein